MNAELKFGFDGGVENSSKVDGNLSNFSLLKF